jgi:hypothetical protein
MNDLNRPIQIMTILETISSGEGAEMSAALEAYITGLETRNQDGHVALKNNNRPLWSHERIAKREAHLRERAFRKQNHFQ